MISYREIGVSMKKTFIGSQLRQLRRDHGQTQAEMGRRLGVSAAYINLLEKNQRSLSVPVLMALADQYNVQWRDVVMDKSANILADLRNAIQDPLFARSQIFRKCAPQSIMRHC